MKGNVRHMSGMLESTGGLEAAQNDASAGLLVIGGGGHGRVVAEAAHLSGHFPRLLVVDPHASENWSLSLCQCVKSEADADVRPQEWRFIAAVGDPLLRQRLFEEYLAKGFVPVTVIHPRAIVSPSAQLGRGVAVCAGAVVATLARIGDGVIVNHNAVAEHDSEVAPFAHLAPGAVLAGGAYLGEKAFLGASASVRHGKRVGAGIIIGNGAAVAADILEPGVYTGTPARLLKPVNLPGEG